MLLGWFGIGTDYPTLQISCQVKNLVRSLSYRVDGRGTHAFTAAFDCVCSFVAFCDNRIAFNLACAVYLCSVTHACGVQLEARQGTCSGYKVGFKRTQRGTLKWVIRSVLNGESNSRVCTALLV